MPSQCNEKDFSDCFLPEKTTIEHLGMSVIVGSMIALKRVQATLAKQIAFFFSKHNYPNVLETYLRICVRKNWGANIFVRQWTELKGQRYHNPKRGCGILNLLQGE